MRYNYIISVLITGAPPLPPYLAAEGDAKLLLLLLRRASSSSYFVSYNQVPQLGEAASVVRLEDHQRLEGRELNTGLTRTLVLLKRG